MKSAVILLGLALSNTRVSLPFQDSPGSPRLYELGPLLRVLSEHDAFEHLGWPQWDFELGAWEKHRARNKARDLDPSAERTFGSRELGGTKRWNWERRIEDLLLLGGISSGELERVERVEGPPSILAVTASSRVHEFLGSVFEQVLERLNHTVEFESFSIDAAQLRAISPLRTQVVYSASEFDAQLERLPIITRDRTPARIGRVTRMGSVEHRTLLWGYFTESYDKGVSPFPERSISRSGLDLYVDASPAVLGGYLLRVRGQRSQLSTREELYSFPGGEQRVVELPTFKIQREGATAIVEDGGGIMLGSNSPDSPAWLIRVRSTQRPERHRAFLPTGGLTAPANTMGSLRFLGPMITGGFLFADDDLQNSLGKSICQAPFQPRQLLDALALLEGGEFAPFWAGTEIYVGEDVERQNRVASFLAAEAARVEQNIAFELRFAQLNRSRGADWLRQPASQFANALTEQILGCCRIGSSATSSQVTSTAYTSDVNVEVSGRNHPGHPIRAALDEGTSIQVHAAPTRRGTLAVEVEFNHQVVLERERKRRVAIPGIPHEENNPATEITLPATTGARFLTPLEVTRGEWNLVGARDLVGTDRMVIAVIRIAPE